MSVNENNRKELIKTMRKQAPRKSHGEWAPATDRPDPISLLQAQDQGRIEQLLPIKYGRMLESPFAFLRGSAVVMAADPEENASAPTPPSISARRFSRTSVVGFIKRV